MLPHFTDPDTFTLIPGGLGKPVRHRWRWHLDRVKICPCTRRDCTTRMEVDPHHLTFVQPKARGLTAGDQWTVPLCRRHHEDLHAIGREWEYWNFWDIDPIKHAIGHWIWSLYLQGHEWDTLL